MNRDSPVNRVQLLLGAISSIDKYNYNNIIFSANRAQVVSDIKYNIMFI